MEQSQNKFSELTRRDIVDMLLLREAPFHGRLDYMDFLKRVWPWDTMRSWDPRFRIATHDIGTHMDFGDWTDSHLLLVRLNLAGGADDEFLRFLETVVHPLVISDAGEAIAVVTDINRLLELDGYHLAEKSRVSGRPVFKAVPVSFAGVPIEPTSWEKVDQQVSEMRDQLARASSEAGYQTVGHLGRELMISLAQAAIEPSDAVGEDGVPPSDTDAVRLLDAYIEKALLGRNNKALRGAVRGVVKATSAVLHDRNAAQQDAALLAELVLASVRLVHILAPSRPVSGSSAMALDESGASELPFE